MSFVNHRMRFWLTFLMSLLIGQLLGQLLAADVTPESRAAADAWLDRAVALGLPDTRGAVFYTGELRAKLHHQRANHRPLWEDWWPLELGTMTDANDPLILPLRLTGVHLRLADGRWLAGCERLIPTDATIEVDAADVQPISDADALPPLAHLSVSSQVGCLHNRDGLLLFISRQGAAGREAFILRQYLSSPWSPLLRSTSLSTGSSVRDRWGAWAEEPDLSQDPAALLPRQIRNLAFIWFAERARDGHVIERATAASAALEFAPPALRDVLTQQFARIAAAAAIPAWEPGGTLDDLLLRWGQGEPPVPELLVMDALVAALTDQRPCAWMEGVQPRLVGDNALRGMAWRLGVDPRLLAGLDATEPWTEEVRVRAAQQLREWWQQHRLLPLPLIAAGAVGSMSLEAQVQAVARTPKGQRQPVIAAITAAWLEHDPFADPVDPPGQNPPAFMVNIPPSPAERARGQRAHVLQMLALADNRSVLLTTLARLPERPATRFPRALASDLGGDPALLDVLIARALQGGCDAAETAEVLEAALLRPSPARLAVARTAIAADGPALSTWRRTVGVLLLQRPSGHNPLLPTHGERAPGAAMRLSLASDALADQRLVADCLHVAGPVYVEWRFGGDDQWGYVPFVGGVPGVDRASVLTIAPDLRVCDVVAFALHELARWVPAIAPAGCVTTAPVAERSAQIQPLRERVSAAATEAWRTMKLIEP